MKITKTKFSLLASLSLLVVLIIGVGAAGQNETGQESYVIKSIELIGNDNISDREILEDLGLKEGDTVSKSGVQEKVKNVRSSGFFKTVNGSTEVSNGEIFVTLELSEYPVLEKYEFTGVNLLNTGKLKRTLKKAGIKKREVINKDELNEGLNKIQEEYEKKGYPFTTIGNVSIDSTLKVEVIEGELAGVRIEGLNTVPEEVALGMIKGDKDKPVKLKDLQKSYRNLQSSVYFSSVNLVPTRGYSEADIILRWQLTERKVVDGAVEGNRIVFEGNTLYPGRELTKLTGDLPRDKITNYDLLRALKEVYGKYVEDGYSYVRFSVEEVAGEAIVLNVSEGRISNITVEGNNKTARRVISNKILLSEGDVYNSKLVQDTRRKLLDLGYFSKVNPQPSRNGEGINLKFSIKEKSRLNSINGGLSWSDKGLAGKLQLTTKHLFGVGQDVSLNLNRKLALDAKFGGSLDWKNVYYPSGFNFTKLSLYRNVGSSQGIEASFGYPLSGKLSLNMGYNADWILGEDADSSPTNILSADLIYDDRNNPIFPTSGTRRSLRLEKAGGFAPGISFTQLTFRGSYFQGLPSLNVAGEKKQTFGFNLQLGLGVDAPENYQAEFGGKSSIRGAESDAAKNYGFLNTEYRLQLVPGSLYISSFVDSGVDLGAEDNFDFKSSAGLEINLRLFGHIRLGAAWRLSGDFNYFPRFYFGMGPIF